MPASGPNGPNPFPEMTLRWAAVVPPMVLFELPVSRLIPDPPLPRSTRPVTSVPIRFPSMVLLSASLMKLMPASPPSMEALLEMTFPAPCWRRR